VPLHFDVAPVRFTEDIVTVLDDLAASIAELHSARNVRLIVNESKRTGSIH
jgi:hypothetical protein